MTSSASIIRTRLPTERKIIPDGEPRIITEARIGAIVRYPVLVDEGHGYVKKEFEKFSRPPGTRIIAVRDNKIFLQQEARLEVDGFDWRLPGGKVFDTFADFKPYLAKPIPENIIIAAGQKELGEEAGLVAAKVRVVSKKVCGATVDWDLYYLEAATISEAAASRTHHEGEQIDKSGWFTFDQVKKMCEKGEIGEGRTAAALIEYMANIS